MTQNVRINVEPIRPVTVRVSANPTRAGGGGTPVSFTYGYSDGVQRITYGAQEYTTTFDVENFAFNANANANEILVANSGNTADWDFKTLTALMADLNILGGQAGTDGQILVKDGGTAFQFRYENKPVGVPTGGSSGDILARQGTDGLEWITPSAAGVTTLAELSDTSFNNLANNDYLKYNGTIWENSPFPTIPDTSNLLPDTTERVDDVSLDTNTLTISYGDSRADKKITLPNNIDIAAVRAELQMALKANRIAQAIPSTNLNMNFTAAPDGPTPIRSNRPTLSYTPTGTIDAAENPVLNLQLNIINTGPVPEFQPTFTLTVFKGDSTTPFFTKSGMTSGSIVNIGIPLTDNSELNFFIQGQYGNFLYENLSYQASFLTGAFVSEQGLLREDYERLWNQLFEAAIDTGAINADIEANKSGIAENAAEIAAIKRITDLFQLVEMDNPLPYSFYLSTSGQVSGGRVVSHYQPTESGRFLVGIASNVRAKLYQDSGNETHSLKWNGLEAIGQADDDGLTINIQYLDTISTDSVSYDSNANRLNFRIADNSNARPDRPTYGNLTWRLLYGYLNALPAADRRNIRFQFNPDFTIDGLSRIDQPIQNSNGLHTRDLFNAAITPAMTQHGGTIEIPLTDRIGGASLSGVSYYIYGVDGIANANYYGEQTHITDTLAIFNTLKTLTDDVMGLLTRVKTIETSLDNEGIRQTQATTFTDDGTSTIAPTEANRALASDNGSTENILFYRINDATELKLAPPVYVIKPKAVADGEVVFAAGGNDIVRRKGNIYEVLAPFTSTTITRGHTANGDNSITLGANRAFVASELFITDWQDGAGNVITTLPAGTPIAISVNLNPTGTGQAPATDTWNINVGQSANFNIVLDGITFTFTVIADPNTNQFRIQWNGVSNPPIASESTFNWVATFGLSYTTETSGTRYHDFLLPYENGSPLMVDLQNNRFTILGGGFNVIDTGIPTASFTTETERYNAFNTYADEVYGMNNTTSPFAPLINWVYQHRNADEFFGLFHTYRTDKRRMSWNVEMEVINPDYDSSVPNSPRKIIVKDVDAAIAGVRQVPAGGDTNQVLTKTSIGYGWADSQGGGGTMVAPTSLADLTDTDLNNLLNGDYLSWNGTDFVNLPFPAIPKAETFESSYDTRYRRVGVNIPYTEISGVPDFLTEETFQSALSQYTLTSTLNNQLAGKLDTDAQIPYSQITGTPTIPDVSGFITQTTADERYRLQSVAIDYNALINRPTIPDTSNLLPNTTERVDDVSLNNTTLTISYGDSRADKAITLPSSGGATSLNDLSDVVLSSGLADGEGLIYRTGGGNPRWVNYRFREVPRTTNPNQVLISGNNSTYSWGRISTTEISDILSDNPQEGQFLRYNSFANRYENQGIISTDLPAIANNSGNFTINAGIVYTDNNNNWYRIPKANFRIVEDVSQTGNTITISYSDFRDDRTIVLPETEIPSAEGPGSGWQATVAGIKFTSIDGGDYSQTDINFIATTQGAAGYRFNGNNLSLAFDNSTSITAPPAGIAITQEQFRDAFNADSNVNTRLKAEITSAISGAWPETASANGNLTDPFTQEMIKYEAFIPSGGTSGQILSKIGNTDYQTGWIDAPSGGTSGITEAEADGRYRQLSVQIPYTDISGAPTIPDVSGFITQSTADGRYRLQSVAISYDDLTNRPTIPVPRTDAEIRDVISAVGYATPANVAQMVTAAIGTVRQVPTGGTSGQILSKTGTGDTDYTWSDAPSGGGGTPSTNSPEGIVWQSTVPTSNNQYTFPTGTKSIVVVLDTSGAAGGSQSDPNDPNNALISIETELYTDDITAALKIFQFGPNGIISSVVVNQSENRQYLNIRARRISTDTYYIEFFNEHTDADEIDYVSRWRIKRIGYRTAPSGGTNARQGEGYRLKYVQATASETLRQVANKMDNEINNTMQLHGRTGTDPVYVRVLPTGATQNGELIANAFFHESWEGGIIISGNPGAQASGFTLLTPTTTTGTSRTYTLPPQADRIEVEYTVTRTDTNPNRELTFFVTIPITSLTTTEKAFSADSHNPATLDDPFSTGENRIVGIIASINGSVVSIRPTALSGNTTEAIVNVRWAGNLIPRGILRCERVFIHNAETEVAANGIANAFANPRPFDTTLRPEHHSTIPASAFNTTVELDEATINMAGFSSTTPIGIQFKFQLYDNDGTTILPWDSFSDGNTLEVNFDRLGVAYFQN